MKKILNLLFLLISINVFSQATHYPMGISVNNDSINGEIYIGNYPTNSLGNRCPSIRWTDSLKIQFFAPNFVVRSLNINRASITSPTKVVVATDSGTLKHVGIGLFVLKSDSNLFPTLSYLQNNYQPIGNYLTSIDSNNFATRSWVNTRGFLTSYTESDPTVASYIKAITSGNISDWNTAYGWGNHASQGYLTSASSLAWAKLTGVPSTFTPSAHTHPISDVIGLGDSLATKFNTPSGTTAQYIRGDGSKATFPSIPAAQVNSDWNSVSGLSQILNKPSLSTVATTGAYSDLSGKPTIPTAVSQLTNDAGYLTGITSGQITTALGYTPYNGTTNPNGFLTSGTQTQVAAGLGIVITGTTTKTIAVDTSEATAGNNAVMYVGKANGAIGQLNSSINGKQAQLNGTGFVKANGTTITYDNSTYITAEVDGSITNEIELPSQTGQSGKYLTTNGTSPSWTTPPGNPTATNFTAYSAGTVYPLTTTSQKVDFGTTDPVITITSPGTYLIFTNLKIEYAGLTTVLNTCNFKLRRTNNTAADIPNATTNFNAVATLLTGTGGDVDIAPIVYTTSNSNDVIELWGNRQNGISITGNINVGEASIVAVKTN